jgi:hypothetical protein
MSTPAPFQPQQGRDGVSYAWWSAPEGDVLKVLVFYMKGRGIHVAIRRVVRKKEGHFVSETFMMFGAPQVSVLVRPVKRISQKHWDAVLDELEEVLPTIETLFAKDPNECKQYLLGMGLDRE